MQLQRMVMLHQEAIFRDIQLLWQSCVRKEETLRVEYTWSDYQKEQICRRTRVLMVLALNPLVI